MSKKTLLFALTFFTITQFTAACSIFPTNIPGTDNNTAKSVTLLVWKPFEESDSFQAIFQAYTQTHKNVHFVYERKDIATYEEDLINALASGSGPDIFSIHNDWLPRYLDKLAPAPSKLFSTREYEDAFVDVARQDFWGADGKLYAVPFSVDTLALYYNRDLLGSAGISQPPRTWAEAITDVKKLTKQDKYGNFVINGLAMGTASNINRSVDLLALLMLQNGTQLYNSNHTQATLDRQITGTDGTSYNPAAQALEFYTQFANPAKETYTWNNRNNYSIDAFVSGQVGMMLSYSYLAPVITSKAPLLNFGIAPVPQIDLSKPRVNFANYFGEGVSKASSNSDVAWDFLKFASATEQLKTYYQNSKVPSSRKDIISEQLGDSQIGVFAEAALTAKSLYKPDAARVDTVFIDLIEDVILRGKTPAQAVGTGNGVLRTLITN